MITNYSPSRIAGAATGESRSLLYGCDVPISKLSFKKRKGHLPLILLFLSFFTQFLSAQTNYYSKAGATDFNDVNSWGTATDGTGTAPASISSSDNFFVANAAALSLSANASVRQLTLTAGSLTVATNVLTVSKVGAFDTTMTLSGGILNLSGSGSIILNGNFNLSAGGKFNQSGGSIAVDGNNGGVATGSVASGTFIVNFSPTANTDVNLSGGIFTIVDPHFATTNTFQVSAPTAGAISATGTHTFRFGDGISTDNGGANGFAYYAWGGTGIFKFRNVLLETVTGGNNRFLLMSGTYNNFSATGNLTINTGAEFRNTGTTTTTGANYFTGNIINNGIFTSSAGVNFSDVMSSSGTGLTVSVATNAQIVSGNGIFRNLTTSPTANFSSIVINNTSTAGVTFLGTSNIAAQPANSCSVSGTLTFTAGKVFTSGGASFILGISASSLGTLSYTAGGFASGTTFGRWFGATTAGTTIAASTDPTSATSRYPFVGTNNSNRSAWIERTTPAAAAGILAVTYTNVDGYATVALADGATTLDTKANDSWAVTSLSGTPTAAASFKLGIVAPSIFGGLLNNNTVRIVKSDNSFAGAHQTGTVTPGGQRITILPADLISGSYTLAANMADIPFVSVANGNWNNPSIWNKGAVPTCGDPVSIGTGTTVTVNSAGNFAKNVIINSGGTLVQASGDLTVDACTSTNNNFLSNSGTLTVTGGSLNVNGNLNMVAGSTFNQSGGNINVDGNQGAVVANSVASGTSIASIATDLVTLTGGTLTVVDPHAANSTSSYAFSYTGTAAVNNTSGWTLKFGNGVSTDAGGTTGTASASGGFIWNNGGGKIYYNSVIIDGGNGTNRNVFNSSTTIGINNLTINANSEFVMSTSGISIGGNLVNNGTFTHNAATLSFQNLQSATAGASANPQTISGTGVFRNNLVLANVTANLSSVAFNNNNATGITLNVPLSVSGTLTMTSGLINTTETNILRLGTATAAGTFSGTPSATNMVKGPFARTIVSGNANTAYVLFPVGKTSYSPIWLAPATTSVSVMKAEAFDSNTGTMDVSIIGLNTAKRWEAPVVSGTITNLNVRLGDAGIVATNIPVQAPAASGAYANIFGIAGTFVAGTPNTIQSTTAVTAAAYTGFIGYATSNACSGTPSPGNTIASATTICNGASVAFSLQNSTVGTGVTYAWESSVDNVTFAPIAGATASTYVATPTAALYYRAQVTCSGNTGVSTPIQVTFTNNITSTTPNSRCGIGTVSLSAAANAGATVNWYDSAVNGALVGSGTTFVTPVINSTTNYYAASESFSTGAITSGTATTLTGATDQPTAFCNRYEAYVSQTIYTAAELSALGLRAGNITSMSYNITTLGDNATNPNFTVKIGTTTATSFANTSFISTTAYTTVYGPSTYTHTAAGWQVINFTTPYPWDGVSNIVINVSMEGSDEINNSQTYYTATTDSKVLYSITASPTTGTLSLNRLNTRFTGQIACASPRVQVAATVTTPPALTLSATTAVICSGQSSAPLTLTSTAADYDTYVWMPATGVSGDAASGWVFNPATTTSYTLTASQSSGSLCSTTATLTISVNSLPSAITVAPSPAIACENVILPLVTTGGTLTVTGVIGSGTAVNIISTPFRPYFGGSKTQAIYTASELTALGMTAGQKVSSIGYVALSGTPLVMNNFTISAGFVGSTLGSTFISGATAVVYAPASYTPATGSGNLDFPLATPLVWDGISNLLIETCFNNNNGGGLAANSIGVQSSTVASGLNLYRSQDNTADVCSNLATPTAVTVRPNLRISIVQGGTVSWSPITNLYSDAAATTPYVSGSNANTVYFKSSTAAPATTYTVTATTAQSCSISTTVNVTVNPTITPDFAAIAPFCAGSTAPVLSTTSPNGVTGTWSPATVSNTAGGNYVFTPSGCGNTQTLTVTVTPVVTPDFAAIAPFCAGSTAPTLATTSPNGVTGTWSPATVSNTAGGNYVFTPTAGLCANTQTLTVTVTPVVTPDFAAIAPFCAGSTAPTLATTSPNGVTGTWSPATVSNTAGGNYVFTPTAGLCANTQTLTVVVTTSVTPNFPPIGTICSNATAPVLATTSPNGVTGTWSPATVNTTTGGTYVFTPTAGTCASTQSLTVAVTTAPSQPTGEAAQTGSTLADLVVLPSTVIWYGSASDASTGNNALALSTPLADSATYYAVQVSGSCRSAALAVTIDFDLSTPSFGLKALKVYPNPVRDIVNISYSGSISSYKLYNTLGQQLTSKNVNANETTIDMSSLAAGSYLLEVTSEGKSRMVKLLKN